MVLPALCPDCPAADVQEPPSARTDPLFGSGERLSFILSWSGIPAGKAVLEVMPLTAIDGRPARHFRLIAESNAFVDKFYKVRDRIDSYVDLPISHSLRYLKKQHEGRRRRDITVQFDPGSRTIHYQDRKKTVAIPLEEGTFDPLGTFYYARTQPLGEGSQIRRPVSDGQKTIVAVAHIVRRETVTVPAGTFETLLMEPAMEHIGGVFEKSKGAKIKLWVTDDPRRLPVKIASKVVVGSFTGELVTVE